MEVTQVPFGGAEYRAACALREAVLRAPLGMALREVDVAGEDAQWHFVALDGGAVIGTVLFKPLAHGFIKLRQMAVAPHWQGKRVGQALVAAAENAARSGGFATVETSARLVAKGFYDALGYHAEGAPYEEVGLPTVRMVKAL